MGTSLGDVFLYLKGDSSHLDKTLDRTEAKTQGWAGKVGGFVGGAFQHAVGGLMEQGITKVVSGFGQAVSAGFSFNNSLEQTTARINAFTKDGQKTADILDTIRERAAKTPFEFDEMSSAAAGLLPVTKASGASLEDLIGKAEILAASNPTQGLEGAAFALKEAVSGDFTSIIERFNLPRKFINDLKEKGVPELEIVQRAMQELGLDTDLVTGLANTAQGRWSTFSDTLTNLASTITQPLFDTFSSGLATVNQYFEENEPLITAFAQNIASGIQGAIDKVNLFIAALTKSGLGTALVTIFGPDVLPVFQQVQGLFSQISSGASSLAETFRGLSTAFQLGGLFGGEVGTSGQQVGGLVQAIGQQLQNGWNNTVMPVLSGWGTQIWAWLADAYANAPNYLNQLLNGINSFLTTQGPLVAEAAKTWGPQFWGWVQSAISGVAGAMGLLLAALVTWATSPEASTQLLALGNNIGKGVWYSISTAFSSGGSSAGNAASVMLQIVGGLATAAAGVVASLVVVGGTLLAGIFSGVGQSLTGYQPWTIQQFQGFASWISNIDWSAVGSGLVGQIANGIESAVYQVGAAINRVIEQLNPLANFQFPDLGQQIADWGKSMAGFSPPEQLQSHSPTPFEMGLRGIADAIQAMPELNFQYGNGMVAQAAAAGTLGGNSTTVGSVSINVSGAGNPAATGQAVRKELESLFNRAVK